MGNLTITQLFPEILNRLVCNLVAAVKLEGSQICQSIKVLDTLIGDLVAVTEINGLQCGKTSKMLQASVGDLLAVNKGD